MDTPDAAHAEGEDLAEATLTLLPAFICQGVGGRERGSRGMTGRLRRSARRRALLESVAANRSCSAPALESERGLPSREPIE